MSTVTTDQLCEPCMFIKVDSVRAEKFCEDCHERYCEPCALHHAKFRVFRNHHVVNIPPCLDYENAQMGVTETVNVTPTDETSSIDNSSDYIDMESLSTKHRDDIDNDCYVGFEFDQKQPTEPVEDSANFDVIVQNTDLARYIRGINHIELPRTHFQFVVCKSGLRLLLGQKTLFRAGFSVLRRFGCKDNLVSIEFGRACELGEGFLKLVTAEARHIVKCIEKQIFRKTSNCS